MELLLLSTPLAGLIVDMLAIHSSYVLLYADLRGEESRCFPYMAFQHCFGRKWKSVPSAPTETGDLNHLDGCFNCNICLDFARDPVVTLCGHLYCWPCIYKWFHIQTSSPASNPHPKCPVCKAEMSHTTLVPLYGQAQSSMETDHGGKMPSGSSAIPPRPPACGTRALLDVVSQPGHELSYRNSYENQHHNGLADGSASPLVNSGPYTLPTGFQPIFGMFGEMVYARVFGNPVNLYAYPNSYHIIRNDNPRSRRQEMQADKSLSRISLFLLCCFILCLLLF